MSQSQQIYSSAGNSVVLGVTRAHVLCVSSSQSLRMATAGPGVRPVEEVEGTALPRVSASFSEDPPGLPADIPVSRQPECVTRLCPSQPWAGE